MQKNVVSLIRVSTDQQAHDDEGGLDRQRRDIRITCQKFGLQDVRQFELEGITGTNVRNTKQFRELKAMVARKDIVGLVIPSVDRMSRSSDFGTVAELFSPFEELLGGKSTKRLYTRTNELDVNKPSDRDIIWSQLRFAEEERLMILYRTSSGRDEKRLDADAKVDRLPKGVIFTRTNPKKNIGVWSYDPVVKERMRNAYHRILAGESLRSLYKEAGFNSPTALAACLKSSLWKGIKSKTRHHTSKVWNEDRNRFMARDRDDLPEEQKIIVPIPALRNDPCVSDDVWDAVQNKLKNNTREWTRSAALNDTFLGSSGLCRCRCGRKLYLKLKDQKYRYYYCAYQRLKKGEPCHEPMIPAKVLEDKIVADVAEFFTNDVFISSRIRESLNAEKTLGKSNAVARYEKEIESLVREKGRVAVAIRKAPDVDVILAQLAAVDEDIAATKERLRVARGELDLVQSESDVKKLAATLTAEYAKFPKLAVADQKALLKKYVSAIHVTWDREPLKFTPKELQYLKEQGRTPNDTGVYLIFEVKVGTHNWTATGSTTESQVATVVGSR
jgi:DNA invertase Pin-like site-specific DNA recombinase